jgi:hypothetical protein
MTTRDAIDSTTASSPSSPTDLELMLYADGELAEERLAAVQAWLEREVDGEDARNKLTSLGIVSDLIRVHAQQASAGHDGGSRPHTPGADGIADAVMRRIEAEPAAGRAGGYPQTPGDVDPHPPGSRPANDNARGFYVIAAAVIAVAAGVLLWARPPTPADRGEVAHVAAPQPTAPILGASAPDAEVDHGVEVAAVDFGARMGAVFYVPTGTSASSTTTVVWLSDDSAGENQ